MAEEWEGSRRGVAGEQQGSSRAVAREVAGGSSRGVAGSSRGWAAPLLLRCYFPATPLLLPTSPLLLSLLLPCYCLLLPCYSPDLLATPLLLRLLPCYSSATPKPLSEDPLKEDDSDLLGSFDFADLPGD